MKTKLTPEQIKALRELVTEYVRDRISASPDEYAKRGGPSRSQLLAEPNEWAQQIVGKWSVPGMLDLLDLDNNTDSYVENVLDLLGFDPRTGTASTTITAGVEMPI